MNRYALMKMPPLENEGISSRQRRYFLQQYEYFSKDYLFYHYSAYLQKRNGKNTERIAHISHHLTTYLCVSVSHIHILNLHDNEHAQLFSRQCKYA